MSDNELNNSRDISLWTANSLLNDGVEDLNSSTVNWLSAAPSSD